MKWRFPKILTIAFFFLPSVLFLVWYFTDIPITNWGNTPMTSSNILESYYWTKRDIFWSKSLNFIENKTNNLELKKILLEKYVDTIPVNQWWSPLRLYKTKALTGLFNMCTESEDWNKLEKNAEKLTEIDYNNAQGWYNLGLALEKQKKITDAIKKYQQARLIEGSHLESTINLTNLFIEKGEYHQAKQIIQDYLETIKLQETYCFFWGDEKFGDGRNICSYEKQDGHPIIKVDTQDKNIALIRIDPPLGAIKINSLEIFSGEKKLKITDFSDWQTSIYTQKGGDNLFTSIGSDPYFYTKLENSEILNGIDYILINAQIDHQANPEIKKILEKINSKIL